MSKIKLCGLTRPRDIEVANELKPEYIGFVFAPKSRRRVTPDTAAALKRALRPDIAAVGVFVDEAPETIAELLGAGIIDIAQLHGREDNRDIARLRRLTGRPIIKAFRIAGEEDIRAARESEADFVLLDSGGGSGSAFDWRLVRDVERPFFLAGGLDDTSVVRAIKTLRPYAVDVSSGIETDGLKDEVKMRAFVRAAREAGE